MTRFLSLFLLVAFVPKPAYCRWAQLEDANALSEKDQYEITINEDGTTSVLRESLLTIKNEEGRTALGNTQLKYNSRTTKLKILKAETILRDQTYPVSPEFIEDKTLASSAEGFDETRQISIAYPKVEVGSQLYLKYREETTEVPIPGFYSDEIFFGTDVYERSAETRISSRLPLYLEVNDPKHVLEVTQTHHGDRHQIKISLKAPIFSKAVDEPDAYLSPRDQTSVVVSSSQDYLFLARAVAEAYEQVLSSPLPAPFEKILAQAKKKSLLVDQINAVTSLLADEVRYLGDWRPRRGGHIPRALETIANTKFGDCKDFSAVTAAILRRLGYEAHIAWVERGVKATPLPKLALDGAFNHAIVFLKVEDRVYWIDPTNFVSFAQGIFDDILDRPALVIDPVHPMLSRIPLGLPGDSRSIKELNLSLQKSGDASIQAILKYQGRSATAIAGISRELSVESINHLLSKAIAEDNYIKSSHVEAYDLSSRVVRDFTFSAHVEVKNFSLKTTAGNAYQLSRANLGALIDLEPETRVSDLFLGPPEIDETTYRLNKVRLVGTIPAGCRLDSPWLKVSRVISQKDGDIVVVDRREVKQNVLTNQEIQGEEFQTFQGKLQNCFHQVAIVYR
jgi:Domain of Unknown Function with PDB structure (DUF3857)/Transglutaminase-like superfamily